MLNWRFLNEALPDTARHYGTADPLVCQSVSAPFGCLPALLGGVRLRAAGRTAAQEATRSARETNLHKGSMQGSDRGLGRLSGFALITGLEVKSHGNS